MKKLLVVLAWLLLISQLAISGLMLASGNDFMVYSSPSLVFAGFLGLFIKNFRKNNLSSDIVNHQKQDEINAIYRRFQNNDLPIVTPQKAIIQVGEIACSVAKASLMEKQTIGYKAGTAGVSFRVAKGLTLRTGGIQGRIVKDLIPVAHGELVITDSRIIFAGDTKSISSDLKQLISVNNYADGIAYSDHKKTYQFMIMNEYDRIKTQAILERMTRNKS